MLRILTMLLVIVIINDGYSASSKFLEIMTYNVENLFDVTHDTGKNDWTFLPLKTPGKKKRCKVIGHPKYRNECLHLDWNIKKLNIKLNNIKKVILKERESPPDFLALQEVENQQVVLLLAKKLGMTSFIVANGPDKRGIDVALLYNESKMIRKISSKEYLLEGKHFLKKPTRTLLEVDFLIDEKYPLTIIINHWPSQANPSNARMIAAEKVVDLVERKLSKNPQQHIVVLGDFNTIPTDYPHPFSEMLMKKNQLIDLHSKFMKDKQIARSIKRKLPLGTYFYYKKMTWNLLDRIFVNRNLLNQRGLEVIIPTYHIYAPKFITHDFKYLDPKDFLFGSVVANVPKGNSMAKVGYSDHFPVSVKLGIK